MNSKALMVLLALGIAGMVAACGPEAETDVTEPADGTAVEEPIEPATEEAPATSP